MPLDHDDEAQEHQDDTAKPAVDEVRARHAEEINKLVEEFGKRHAELLAVEPRLREVTPMATLKKEFREAVQAAVKRHTEELNAPPA